MHKRKVVYSLIAVMMFILSVGISSTVVLSQTNNALVTKTPEQSNLIIDCSFGEEGKEDCGVKHFFQLANNIMKLLLWVAVTGAGLLIFYKGTKLAINVFTKGGHQQARKEVQDALKATLVGLLFILSAYLIVKAGFDIIGYNLNDGDPFKYDESSLPAPDVSRIKPAVPAPTKPAEPTEPTKPAEPTEPTNKPPTDTPQINTPQGCSGCQTKTSDVHGVTFKKENILCASVGGSCWVNNSIVSKLEKLAQQSSATWWVTEACPPTVTHRHSCHRTDYCDCVDVNFKYGDTSRHNPTAQEVEDFIQEAGNIGLYAVYEIPPGSLRTTIPAKEYGTQGKIIHIGVPKPHFSIYASKEVHDRR